MGKRHNEQDRAAHRALVAETIERVMADPVMQATLRALEEYDRTVPDTPGGDP